MHPTFAGLGPFYRWQCEESNSEHLGLTAEDINRERETVRNHLGNLLKQVSDAPYVGIVAFSQGCGIATVRLAGVLYVSAVDIAHFPKRTLGDS
ncbi:hypothetical protein CH35J_011038 [Colletotrichum higginsianum]|uniref:Uncharacterized protein n=1 Tax=Colletotrichum higginsianum TaxID=80884 RepID=A0A4T0VGB5_9PEZI|nr:hypothetical protein CH35J_011038 [Colletotrichum higginsianum]